MVAEKMKQGTRHIMPLEGMVAGEFRHLSAPEIVCWDVTLLCNQACISCYNFERGGKQITLAESKAALEEKRAALPGHEPDLGKAMEILGALAEGRIFEIDFMGGEPMSYKHIGKLVDEAHKRGIISNFITNGCYVDGFLEQIDEVRGDLGREEYLKKTVNHVGFSLHGPTPEKHDAFTMVDGSFDKAVEGMKRLQALGVSVGVLFSPTKDTKDDLYETVKRLVQDEGVHLHTVYLTRLVRVGGCGINKERMLDADQYLEMIEQLVKIKADFGITAKTTDAVPYCKLLTRIKAKYKEELERMTVEEMRKFILPYLDAVGACYFGTDNMAVSKDGLAKICTIPPDRFNLGSVTEEGVREIWKKLAKYREPKAWAHRCMDKEALCGLYEDCRGACKITHAAKAEEDGARIYSQDEMMIGAKAAAALAQYFGIAAGPEERVKEPEACIDEDAVPKFIRHIAMRPEEGGELLYEASREVFRSGRKFLLDDAAKRFVELADGRRTLAEIAPEVGGLDAAKEMYTVLHHAGVME
ncbi:MAG: radical SAM protein [Nanoarchaeota archaeon]|nr:radical SAM protein [Nanoarchaeota archaeon]